MPRTINTAIESVALADLIPHPLTDGAFLRCPVCRDTVRGFKRAGGVIVYRFNRAYNTITLGTITCQCSAILVIVGGVIAQYAAPERIAAILPNNAKKIGV